MTATEGYPRTSIRRRIEWVDTDAAGIYHWTAACRLAEAAETELLNVLGLGSRTNAAMPRVAVSLEFKRPLRFNDTVEVAIEVEHVGTSSVRYAIELAGPDGLAATVSLTTCHIDRSTGHAQPWPDEIRAALTGGGGAD